MNEAENIATKLQYIVIKSKCYFEKYVRALVWEYELRKGSTYEI